MKLNLKRYKHSVGQNAQHLVWKPYKAQPIFNNLYFRKACEGALRLIAMQHGFKICELQVKAEHIHLFVEFPKTKPLVTKRNFRRSCARGSRKSSAKLKRI